MITPKQEETIKNQLVSHIEKSFPEEKKGFAKQKVLSMNSEELENFLKQNKLLSSEESSERKDCVFCSIVSGNLASYKTGENRDAIAVLEINPVSKGHTIIIPKNHVASSDKLKKSVFSLAKDISKKIKKGLKPENVTITSSNIMGHEIINVIPFYSSQENPERHTADTEELKQIQTLLKGSEKIKQTRKRKILKKTEEKIWLPRRIP